MSMVNLERARVPNWKGPTTYFHIKRALPFVESFCGRYTHRVRSIHILVHDAGAAQRILGQAHMSVHCWCGMSVLISEKRRHANNALVVEPSRVLCATCEGRAIGAGQLGTPEIAGRPVMFSPRRGEQ